jgi:UDPglucose 6-dehydrogenase
LSNVGWVGLGKLGGPCAATLQYYGGHKVFGYDVRGVDAEYDFGELDSVDVLESINDVVTMIDGVVFVAVQTPHSPEYGGEQPTPVEPREFEYAYLVNAVRAVCRAAWQQEKHITLVVVSTVLPGTFDRYLRPLLNEYVTPVYHPFFIAMGTVVRDFAQPEMRLFGVDDPKHTDVLHEIYSTMHSAPAPTVSIASAELTKVSYNTFISMKIVYANLLAEMCEVTGADVDEVIDALVQGDQRIISASYLRAGMGDGGACHPRDNVALSALAQRYNLSSDLMGFLNEARDRQALWFARIIEHWRNLTGLPVTLLGKSYKPDVTLTDGSPALLLAHYLRSIDVEFEHDDLQVLLVDDEPRVIFITTRHEHYRTLVFPTGSVVIDPFGYLDVDDARVTYVTPGRKR